MMFYNYLLCISTSFWVPQLPKKLVEILIGTSLIHTITHTLRASTSIWVWTSFKEFFSIFQFLDEKSLKNVKIQQKSWKRVKKVFQPAFGCAQHPKSGKNTQQALRFFNEIIQRYLLMRKYLAQMSMEILAQLLSLYQLFRLQWFCLHLWYQVTRKM